MLQGLGTEICDCGPNANVWIQYWFSDCVYTQWETVAFFIGLSSMLFWIVAQLPQFITNIINQSAEALSPWFLFQWLSGDTFNLLGCLLTGDQLVTETLTATYFIFADFAIIFQYIYYQLRNKDKFDVLDESVHKPSHGYLDVVQSDHAAKLQDLLERASLPESSSAGYDKKKLLKTRDELQNALKHCALPEQRIDVVKQDEKVVDLKKQVRRVVTLYGLEYGPPKASKITVGQIQRLQEQQKSSSNMATKAPAITAAACVTGLFLICSSVGNGHPTTGYATSGRMLGRRSLLSFSREQGKVSMLPSSNGAAQWLHPASARLGRKLLVVCGYSSSTVVMHTVGTCLGWASSTLYLGSRVAQLRKNQQRQSAEGLSMGMVVCAMLANLSYGASILMRANSWDDIMSKAPWLLGSLGTVSMDITLFLQSRYFAYRLASKSAMEPNERTPLLA